MLTSASLGGLTGPGALRLSNTAASAVALSVGNNNSSTTYSGMLQGPGNLTKIGSGGLLLTGSNSYVGGTVVNAGTLQAAGTASLPGYATPGKITVGSAATLAVSAGGSGWTAAGIGTLLGSNSGGFASGSILGIDTSGGSLSYDSNIVGNMGLAKLGGNTLLLSGSNTYSGGTTVDAGVLYVTNSNAIPAAASLTVGAGGTFIFDPSAAGSLAAASTISPVPEPSTLALLAAGAIGLVGYGLQRRRVARTANPAALALQVDDPAILSFPSSSFPVHAARRAA